MNSPLWLIIIYDIFIQLPSNTKCFHQLELFNSYFYQSEWNEKSKNLLKWWYYVIILSNTCFLKVFPIHLYSILLWYLYPMRYDSNILSYIIMVLVMTIARSVGRLSWYSSTPHPANVFLDPVLGFSLV